MFRIWEPTEVVWYFWERHHVLPEHWLHQVRSVDKASWPFSEINISSLGTHLEKPFGRCHPCISKYTPVRWRAPERCFDRFENYVFAIKCENCGVIAWKLKNTILWSKNDADRSQRYVWGLWSISKASCLKSKFFLVGPTLGPDLAHARGLFLLAIFVYWGKFRIFS